MTNTLAGILVVISFVFFLLGIAEAEKVKDYKKAYKYNFIALLTLGGAHLIELYL